MVKKKQAKSLKSLIISVKKATLDQIWEVPIFYKLLQATLAAGGHDIIKKYLLSEVPKNTKTILDQGCGTGEYSLLFGKNIPDWIMIQITWPMPGPDIRELLSLAMRLKWIKLKIIVLM